MVFRVLRRHAIAFVALFLLLGGSAYAVADQVGNGASPKQLYACVAGNFHTLNLTSAGGNCPSGQSKISWNTAGPDGVAGPRGATGTTGARGATGAHGAVGPKGNAGAAGSAGPQGPAGSKGDTGAKGDNGAAGSAGTQGPAGPKGDTGDTGAAGPAGPAGAIGPAGPIGPTGPIGAAGADGVSAFAEFFALMPPDNSATVPAGGAVDFPQDGPNDGNADITRINASSFVLANAGTYDVAFSVPVDEAGQLELTLNGAPLAYTVSGRATGTSPIAGEALVTASAGDVVTVISPASAITALTISELAGGAEASSATLVIERLS
jgi:BclA C-terminal domain/Collagen triple helix repeat (20 copies)